MSKTLRLCTLASGSSGNCIYVGHEDAGILVDCGVSGKYALKTMEEAGIDITTIRGIVVSHEHIDHVSGAGILCRKLKIPIYANRKTWYGMEKIIGKIPEEHIKIIEKDERISIEGIDILLYPISHDANDPSGLILEYDLKKIAIATDLGYFSEDIYESIKDADMILLEANHEVEMLMAGSYPYALKRRILSDTGHLSNEAAGNAICRLIKNKVKKIILGHLSNENNDPLMAKMTVESILKENKIVLAQDITIEVAPRSMAGRMIEV